MSDVLGSRENIEQQEVQAEAAASEGTMTKIAANINFQNRFFTGPRMFLANGPYDNGIIPETLLDGPTVCESKCEIYAITFFNLVAGSSGTTEFDIVCHPANGDPSYTIFTTTPKIPSTASHTPFAVCAQVFTPVPEILRQSTGTVAAVLISTNVFQKGDAFKMSFLDKQTDGENCGVQLSLRPIS